MNPKSPYWTTTVILTGVVWRGLPPPSLPTRHILCGEPLATARVSLLDLMPSPDLANAYLALLRESATIAAAYGIALRDYAGFPEGIIVCRQLRRYPAQRSILVQRARST